jgi:hypothetical protein
MEFNGWNRVLFAAAETARGVHVPANLDNDSFDAPTKRDNLNLIAREGDVQMNWPQQIKYFRQHVGARMTPNEFNCDLMAASETASLNTRGAAFFFGN